MHSFAIVLWEVWERRLPFEDLHTPWDIREAVVSGRRPPTCRAAPQCSALMEMCWAQDPAARPTFAQIVAVLADIGKTKTRHSEL